MNHDPIAQVQNRLAKITGWFNIDVAPFESGQSDQVEAWRKRLEKLKEMAQERPQTPIALLGSTGAGKSTLLNALLGDKVLPVSTVKPCTAVITTVRVGSENIFRAQIRFLSQAEWESDLRAYKELTDVETDQDEPDNLFEWGDLKEDIRAKLCAVYGKDRISPDNPIDLNALPLPKEVSSYMRVDARPLVIETRDKKDFRKELRQYLSGDGCYWPLVKSVDISGPFDVLRNGAVLIDLPGINDPNEAREQVTRKYLQDAYFTWIVFNMNRGMTKDIRDLLREQKLLRQFLIEGKVHSLTLVGTHADEFNDDDVIEELDLPEDMGRVAVMRERNAKVVQEARYDLYDIAGKLARHAIDSTDALPRLKDTLSETRIITVATLAYMKLAKIGRQRKDYGITSVSDTGVPELLEYMKVICQNQNPQTYAQDLDFKQDFLLKEMKKFFYARRSELKDRRGELDQQWAELRGQLEQPRRELQRSLGNARFTAEKDFHARQKVFRSQIKNAVERAYQELEGQLRIWRLLHWATLRAVVVRHGRFVSPTSGWHDFNAQIADPLMDAISFAWDDFFDLGNVMAELRGDLVARSEGFLKLLDSEARAAGEFDNETLSNITGDIQVSSQNLRDRMDEVLKEIEQTIKRVRLELADSIKETIENRMRPAYEKAKEEQGHGMKRRMLYTIQSYTREVARDMFDAIEVRLTDGVEELRKQFNEHLEELNQDILHQADRVIENLGGGQVLKETEDTEATLDRITAILKRAESL